ncbi:MAG TPA: family 16 glycoside hydrolase, partial [Rhizomicrobium sp.]
MNRTTSPGRISALILLVSVVLTASAAAEAVPPAKPDSRFLQPLPLNFDDHEGFASIFDGTLDGWDGDRRFWRIEDGNIVGESTPDNPAGNSYLTYRKLTAHDFDLRLEIKVEKTGGSGIQYRSRTGVPWRGKTPPAVLANVGPYNSDTMLTGPQADFQYPVSPKVFAYNGQVFAENSPMGVEAWLGQVVRQYGADQSKKKLVGTIAPQRSLIGAVNGNDWNQYE